MTKRGKKEPRGLLRVLRKEKKKKGKKGKKSQLPSHFPLVVVPFGSIRQGGGEKRARGAAGVRKEKALAISSCSKKEKPANLHYPGKGIGVA